MATLTIRGLDEDLKLLLRLRAADNDRSMEEEARQILHEVLTADSMTGAEFYRQLRELVEPGGIDLESVIPPREPIDERRIPNFMAPEFDSEQERKERLKRESKPQPKPQSKPKSTPKSTLHKRARR